LVAIHQPNFFPWLGYFDKLARCDAFVLLDNVQFPRSSRGTYVNRVRVLVNDSPRWLTVPVARKQEGTPEIRDIRISESEPWRERLQKTIHHSYRRAPHFDEVFPRIEELIGNPAERIADYNETVIRSLAADLGIDASKVVLGSSLDVEGSATDLLISITRAVGGTAYLSGGGAGGYQEDERFEQAGLELTYQDFQHPDYPQLVEPAVPGLSVIDALMSCGFEGTAALLGA
jgi:hypothetical protein